MKLTGAAVNAAIVGSLIALGIVAVILYFTWPSIVKKIVGGVKQEATAQNILQSFLNSFNKPLA